MAETLLDSSVIIAFILNEPHQADENEILADASITSVNLAEVIAVLAMKGIPDEVIAATIRKFALNVLPFDEEAAAIAGRLIPKARTLGIGLGDCACIAVGIARGMKIITADRDWLKLDAPANIRSIR